MSIRIITKKYSTLILSLITVALCAYLGLLLSRSESYEHYILAGKIEKIEKNGLDPVTFGLPATAREIPTLRTDRTVTFEISPGTFAQVSHREQLKAKDSSGKLVPLQEEGTLTQNVFTFDHLPDDITIIFDLKKPSYVLRKGEYWFSISFAGNAAGYVVDRNAIQYRLGTNALLRWSVVGANVQKMITIENAEQLPDLSFKLEHSSNLKTIERDGEILLVDESGIIIFHTQAPYLMDAQGAILDRQVTLMHTGDRLSYRYDATGLEYPYIIDPTAGANSPSTLADDSGVGTLTWANPANAGASDDIYASSTSNTSSILTTHYLKATNFGFSIPAGSTITGVVLQVERKCSNTGTIFCRDTTIKLVKGGTVQGNNNSTSTNWATTETSGVYGSSSDLWGLTLTASDVNASDFGGVISISQRGQAP